MIKKQTKITIILDQEIQGENTETVTRMILGDKSAYGRYRSFSQERVKVEGVYICDVAGGTWFNYIKQFPYLDAMVNNIPLPARLILAQQIDIFAGYYPISKS